MAQSYDAFTLLKRQLEDHLHEALEDKIMQDLTRTFQEQAKPIIKAEVEKITLQTIDNIRDLMSLKDEVKAHFVWTEGDR